MCPHRGRSKPLLGRPRSVNRIPMWTDWRRGPNWDAHQLHCTRISRKNGSAIDVNTRAPAQAIFRSTVRPRVPHPPSDHHTGRNGPCGRLHLRHQCLHAQRPDPVLTQEPRLERDQCGPISCLN